MMATYVLAATAVHLVAGGTLGHAVMQGSAERYYASEYSSWRAPEVVVGGQTSISETWQLGAAIGYQHVVYTGYAYEPQTPRGDYLRVAAYVVGAFSSEDLRHGPRFGLGFVGGTDRTQPTLYSSGGTAGRTAWYIELGYDIAVPLGASVYLLLQPAVRALDRGRTALSGSSGTTAIEVAGLAGLRFFF